MPLIDFFILLLGLFLVVKGADLLLSSAIAIGKKYKISDFFIGLAIVGFGTSLPELLVSIEAILKRSPDLSVGNVIGSNISNIILVLGVVLIFSKITINKISRFDVFFHLICHLILLCFIWFLNFTYMTGILFIALFIYYLFQSFKNSLTQEESEQQLNDLLSRSILKNPIKHGLPILIISTFLTFTGAEFTVRSAIEISAFYGISNSFFGLTVVAVGTSLPEIITSVKAAKRKKSELIIGNIIGSNIYNLLLILGLVSLFESFVFSEILFFEVFFLVFCVLCFSLTLFFTSSVERKYVLFPIIFYIFYLIKVYLTNF